MEIYILLSLDVTFGNTLTYTGDYDIMPAPDSDILKQVMEEEESASDGIVSSDIAGTKRSAPFPDAISAKKLREHPEAGMGMAVGENENSKSSFHLSLYA